MEESEKQSLKYFMSLEKAKAKAKAMKLIINEKGKEIRNKEMILAEQKKYYEKLYTKDKEISFSLTNESGIVIKMEHKEMLDTPITLEELGSVLRQMDSSSAPGLDGLTAAWYKMFWPKVKHMFFEAILASIEQQCLYQTTRQGLISLIPKKGGDQKFIAKWRPITLLAVDYKFFSKAIANRLKIALPTIINSDQTGFMAGRNISDNIRTVIDVIDFTMMKQIPSILISVDFMKAFDRVDYQSLFQALQYFGFGDKFIDFIKLLYQDFTLKTTNNGYFSEEFEATQRLFQGNPVSSLFFSS